MRGWFALPALVLSLQGCYTRLYLGENEARAEADSLAILRDSAAAVDSLYSTDRIIINRYYDQRRYRGFPYEEWDDPFFELRSHPRLHGYWEYYYDPYWEYRRPYRRSRSYRSYPPYYPQGNRPVPGRSDSSGRKPRNLYPPAPRNPPPERGKRKEGADGSQPQPRTQEPEKQPEQQPEQPASGKSAGDTAAGDGQSNPPPAIPPPDRGKRK
jgi:hypothetical protein